MSILPLSIIIPVYNTEKWLPRAFESIRRQNIDLEVIVVNDASNGECKNICEFWKSKLKKLIYVEHSQNKGCLQARLTGLKYASGEFIHFFDPDDSIEFNAYPILVQFAIENCADIVQFKSQEVKPNGEIIDWVFSQGWPQILGSEELLKILFVSCKNWNVWNKIFRKRCALKVLEMFNGLFIPHINRGEDIIISFAFFLASHNYYQCNRVSYFYCPTQISISHTLNLEKLNERIKEIHARTILLRQLAAKGSLPMYLHDKFEIWLGFHGVCVLQQLGTLQTNERSALCKSICQNFEIAAILQHKSAEDITVFFELCAAELWGKNHRQ